MRSVRGIYRYPIKGLSPQPLPGVAIEEGKPFPFDRIFALVRPGVSFETEEPRWAKKGLFLMLMLEDSLARVRTQLDVETLQLDVFSPNARIEPGSRQLPLLSVNLGSVEGRAAAEAFFFRQVGKLKAQPRLVQSRHGHFMDKPDNVISCINLATLRSLEAKWGGTSVHPLRFRANFYIEGLRPWEELDWVGSDIRLGDVLFRVDRRNGRCSATNVNPVSGERDMDIPGALRKSFGHKDLGVYLVAQSSGKVVLGDPVTVPDITPSSEPVTSSPPLFGAGSYICRGCYYILDPARGAPGVPPGTDFEAINADFRCPDCGTDKSNFRRHLADAALSEGASVARA